MTLQTHNFEDWFNEYCDVSCPTEGYDDAKAAALAAFNFQQEHINKLKTKIHYLSSHYKTNMTVTELGRISEYVKDNNRNIFTLTFSRDCGIGNTVRISDRFDTPQTDITDYESW